MLVYLNVKAKVVLMVLLTTEQGRFEVSLVF